MAMMSGALYDALIEAGTSNTKAHTAAEEVADIRTEFAKISGRFDVLEAKFDLVKWMVGLNLTLTVLSLGGTFGVLWHLAGK